MSAWLGTSLPVFVGLTLILMGFAAYMTGQACAGAWRPMWHLIPYGLLLGCADRFLIFALFQGELLLISGYAIDTALLLGISAFGYRLTRARRMVRQYPWLYERRGLLNWRAKTNQDDWPR